MIKRDLCLSAKVKNYIMKRLLTRFSTMVLEELNNYPIIWIKKSVGKSLFLLILATQARSSVLVNNGLKNKKEILKKIQMAIVEWLDK